MSQLLEVDVSRVDGAHVLTARGELEMASALGLATPLTEIAGGEDGPVLLDFSELTFMDSTGMSVLLNARRRLTRQGRTMAIVCPPGAVRRVFELTNMVDTLKVHGSRDAALGVLNGG
jgi:anti-sigma B factor antagonist